MNKYLLNSDSPYILNYVKTGLAEQQMVILAAIIRDLDRETARTETGQFVKVCLYFNIYFNFVIYCLILMYIKMKICLLLAERPNFLINLLLVY